MKVVIIAAGAGSRLWERSQQTPKTLLPFGNGTILSTIISNFASVGLREFIIVVGFRAEDISEYVERHDGLGASIELVENAEWHRGNGLSVLTAAERVGDEPFVLSMSDHIVPATALDLVARHPSDRNLLLVDRQIDEVFDLPDATKVRLDGNTIIGIGKHLCEFDAIDCGIFRLDSRFFDSMRRQLERGEESISGGVADLIRTGQFEAVFLPPGYRWFDLDTPEGYRHALAHARSATSHGAFPHR